MFKDDLLKGKKILVTGGGTGLGKEMSEHYIQHGAEVIIVVDERVFLQIRLQNLKINMMLV